MGNLYTNLADGILTATHIAKFMGPIWGPPGSCRPQIGPMLAPWTLLSGDWGNPSAFAIDMLGFRTYGPCVKYKRYYCNSVCLIILEFVYQWSDVLEFVNLFLLSYVIFCVRWIIDKTCVGKYIFYPILHRVNLYIISFRLCQLNRFIRMIQLELDAII